MNYKEPKFNENSFTCPYCGTFAEQKWSMYKMLINWENKFEFASYTIGNKIGNLTINQTEELDSISISTCNVCNKYHIWHNDKMIIPTNSPIPMPLEDMPEVVKNLYLEARDVHPISYKASCALLRLALQHLCEELLKDRSTGQINKDIGELVKEAVPQEFQQALDIVRVVGNNAVHPGKMDESDVEEYAITLFELLNYIVQEKIVRPKMIDGIYNKLPNGVLKEIKKRDNKELVTSK